MPKLGSNTASSHYPFILFENGCKRAFVHRFNLCMTGFLFLAFVVLTAAGVFVVVARYHDIRSASRVLAALSAWLVYVGLIGYFGVVRNPALRPPGPVFLFVPVVVFLVLFISRALLTARGNHARMIPLWLLLGGQSFRVIVELFIHQLWTEGLVPKMLTFSGANVDIYVGASAPLIAWLATRGRAGMRFALAWNVLGLLALCNVVVRAVGTAPGPLNLIHAEVPDLMIGTFPFMFIPGFFVPLAVMLHVFALKAVSHELRAATD